MPPTFSELRAAAQDIASAEHFAVVDILIGEFVQGGIHGGDH
jgi:hypothetical protein